MTVPFTIVEVVVANGCGDCVLTTASFGNDISANLRVFAKVTASRLEGARI